MSGKEKITVVSASTPLTSALFSHLVSLHNHLDWMPNDAKKLAAFNGWIFEKLMPTVHFTKLGTEPKSERNEHKGSFLGCFLNSRLTGEWWWYKDWLQKEHSPKAQSLEGSLAQN